MNLDSPIRQSGRFYQLDKYPRSEVMKKSLRVYHEMFQVGQVVARTGVASYVCGLCF